MKYYFCVLASMAIMFCLGSTYAWSIFAPGLRDGYGLSLPQIMSIFGIRTAVLSLIMILAGQAVPRFGVRTLAGAGGLVFAAGHLIAAVSSGSFALLLLGMGVLAGIGMGAGYLAALLAGSACFPAHRGLVTGLTVAGFGGGAIGVSCTTPYFILQGFDVLSIFAWMGIIYAAVILFSAIFLLDPEAGTRLSDSSEIGGQLRSPQAAQLCAGKLSGNIAGLIFISSLVPIAMAFGISQTVASLSIALFAAGNTVGRILWGKIHDAFGFVTIPTALCLLALSLFALPISTANDFLFMLCASVIGVNFGANFVLFAAQTAQYFGVRALSTIYPYIFAMHGLAALIGAPLSGALLHSTGNASHVLTIAGLIALMGAALVMIIDRRRRGSELQTD